MFTGLVTQTGSWRGRRRATGSWEARVEVDAPWSPPLVVGESIAVQGACLTVVRDEGRVFLCNVLEETLRRTTLGELNAGDCVNLERALRVGDRLGGHMVQGHVDGTGEVESVGTDRGDRVARVRCPRECLGEMVVKGSVACDGVSLTVSDLWDDGFQVNVIPHTWEVTALRSLRAGSGVNIETDIIAKYVQRARDLAAPAPGIDQMALQRAGFCA